MKKYMKFASLLAAASLLCGCSASAADDEIQIPIYNEGSSYTTMDVTLTDLSSSVTMGGSIGYIYAESLSTEYDSNLISIDVSKYQVLKEGDVIAVLDSSSLDYEYLAQEILVDSAYEVYTASPSEENRLKYEVEKAALAEIQYKIDSFVIKAPYDCIISDVSRIEVGSEVSAGTYIASVAREDEIYAYCSDDGSFVLGSKVSVKLTGDYFDGTVVSVPTDGNVYTSSNSNENRWESEDESFIANRYVVIGFEPEVLTALLEETPNAVIAGWCTVVGVVAEKHNVIAVPSSAVKKYGSSIYVYILENGEKFRLPVELGDEIDGKTVILSGLHEGDTIIL